MGGGASRSAGVGVRVLAPLAALAIALMFNLARRQLAGVESNELAAWPSHVIFGLYFAVLTLALQGLHKTWRRTESSAQALLLLILACLCADLVLVNVQEVYRGADASYGLVVIWDMAAFFIWLRAIDLAAGEDTAAFWRSSCVAMTPVLALGREILFLPYEGSAERAYLDLVFGNGFVSLWTAAAMLGARHKSLARLLVALVTCGCVYWLANAVENLLFLAWPPLPKLLYAAADEVGVKVYWLSVFYALIGAIATVFVATARPKLAARLGLR
jgi:hypothetical protein